MAKLKRKNDVIKLRDASNLVLKGASAAPVGKGDEEFILGQVDGRSGVGGGDEARMAAAVVVPAVIPAVFPPGNNTDVPSPVPLLGGNSTVFVNNSTKFTPCQNILALQNLA